MFKVGDRVKDFSGDTATVMEVKGDKFKVDWDEKSINSKRGWKYNVWWSKDDGLIEPAKPEIDLTKIDKPLGLLDPEVRKALEECGGPWDHYTELGWKRCVGLPAFLKRIVYRKAPGPVRETVTIDAYVSSYGSGEILIADVAMRIPNATITYETVDGVIDWSTYRVKKND